MEGEEESVAGLRGEVAEEAPEDEDRDRSRSLACSCSCSSLFFCAIAAARSSSEIEMWPYSRLRSKAVRPSRPEEAACAPASSSKETTSEWPR
jgi:hypothetical protein